MLVWIRMGDADDYHDFDSPEEAGYYVGYRLSEWNGTFYVWRSGVEIPPEFVDRNYISLFWGDKDAQYERGLDLTERDLFERGVLSVS